MPMGKEEWRMIQEIVIVYLFDIIIGCLTILLMDNIYIHKLDLYINLKTIKVIYFMINAMLLITIPFCIKKSLISRVLILCLPIHLFVLVKTMSVSFYVGLILMLLVIVACLFYAYFYIQVNRKKGINYYNMTYRLLLIVAIVSFMSIPALKITGLFQKESTIQPVSDFKEVDRYALIEKHMNELKYLDKKIWKTTSDQQKLNTLQTIVNIESSCLGIQNPPQVKANYKEDLIKGSYNHQENMIQINLEYLREDDSHQICQTILHECRHKYQHEVVESAPLDKQEYMSLSFYQYPKKIQESLRTYSSVEKDFDKYYETFIEVEARDYANIIIVDYNKKIPNMTK